MDTAVIQDLSGAMFAAEMREERTQTTPSHIPPIPTGPLSQLQLSSQSTGSNNRARGPTGWQGPRVPLTQLHSTPPPLSALPLPFLSTATKAEQYERVVAFDRRALKRHKAHQRNAMKTTENLEQVFRELRESLGSLEGADKEMSFERLSAFADAFQELVKISGVFSPLLQKIKDAYDHQLQSVISRERTSGFVLPPIPRTVQPRPSHELYHLRRQLHHLEVQCRVTLHENERLRQELRREEEIHRRVMEELQAPVEDPSDTPSSPQSKDYASRVEDLQLKIAEQQDAIVAVSSKRSGRVPLSVCHQLEQCLREVEVETQKLQKRNKSLKQQIQDAESQLAKLLQGTDETTTSKLWRGLQESIS